MPRSCNIYGECHSKVDGTFGIDRKKKVSGEDKGREKFKNQGGPTRRKFLRTKEGKVLCR